MSPDPTAANAITELALDARAVVAGRAAVIGICGAQGSGKSTLANAVTSRLLEAGIPVAVISLDDLYLTRAERQSLASTVHPLLATRGVPGTHDVRLGLQVLDALSQPGSTRLPRFDKARDDRMPAQEQPEFAGPAAVVLIEGWLVGAVPQVAAELEQPINALERDRDADGRWRRYVNTRLAGDYAGLFSRIDRLVLLSAPGFGIVQRWRTEQEHELRSRLLETGQSIDRTLSDAQIGEFIQHYERLTTHILNEMPKRADLVIRLDEDRACLELVARTNGDKR